MLILRFIEGLVSVFPKVEGLEDVILFLHPHPIVPFFNILKSDGIMCFFKKKKNCSLGDNSQLKEDKQLARALLRWLISRTSFLLFGVLVSL